MELSVGAVVVVSGVAETLVDALARRLEERADHKRSLG
jgi:hypothetical protein